jgi:hypothetical protein
VVWLRRSWIGLAVAAWSLGWSPPVEADSPEPELEALDAMHSRVATNGVLVFHPRGWFVEEILYAPNEVLEVDARLSDGRQVPGSLEYQERLLIWRPNCALPAHERLDVRIRWAGDRERWFSESAYTFWVTEGRLPALGLPETCFGSTYDFRATASIENMVCCDGAYPSEWTGWEDYDDEPPRPPEYSEGYCTYLEGKGYAVHRFAFSPAMDEAVAANLLLRPHLNAGPKRTRLASEAVFEDEEIVEHSYYAADVRLELISLVDGQSALGEPVRSDGGFPEGLGEILRDVTADLEANCETPPYTCGTIWGDEYKWWDSEDCEPYEGSGGIDTDSAEQADPGPCIPYGEGLVVSRPPSNECRPGLQPESEPRVPSDDALPETRGCACSIPRTAPSAPWLVVPLLLTARRRRVRNTGALLDQHAR